jgi:hypothetical protein
MQFSMSTVFPKAVQSCFINITQIRPRQLQASIPAVWAAFHNHQRVTPGLLSWWIQKEIQLYPCSKAGLPPLRKRKPLIALRKYSSQGKIALGIGSCLQISFDHSNVRTDSQMGFKMISHSKNKTSDLRCVASSWKRGRFRDQRL